MISKYSDLNITKTWKYHLFNVTAASISSVFKVQSFPIGACVSWDDFNVTLVKLPDSLCGSSSCPKGFQIVNSTIQYSNANVTFDDFHIQTPLVVIESVLTTNSQISLDSFSLQSSTLHISPSNLSAPLISIKNCATFSNSTIIVDFSSATGTEYHITVLDLHSSCSKISNSGVKFQSPCQVSQEKLANIQDVFTFTCSENYPLPVWVDVAVASAAALVVVAAIAVVWKLINKSNNNVNDMVLNYYKSERYRPEERV